MSPQFSFRFSRRPQWGAFILTIWVALIVLVASLVPSAFAASKFLGTNATASTDPEGAATKGSLTVAQNLPPSANETNLSATSNPRALMERLRAAIVANDTTALGNLVDWPPQSSPKEREHTKLQLLDALNRYGDFNLSLISSNPQGDSTNDDDPALETVGSINTGRIKIPIVLRNLAVPSGKSANASSGALWKLSRTTLESLSRLENLPPSWIEELITALPYGKALLKERAGLALWQWIGALLFLVACIGLGKLIAWIVDTTFAKASRLGRWGAEGPPHGLTTPIAIVIAVTVFRISLPSLGIAISYREFLLTAVRLTQIFFVALLASRLVHMGFVIYSHILRKADRAAATALLPPLRKAIKTIIGLVAIIAAMRTLGFDVSAIIAGLGVGGLAVALAGQKTVENLFGGVSVVLDQPVRVGDMGKYGSVVGVVEDIGLRSTRIRTPDRSIVTIPNAEFSQIQIENLTARDRMRYTMILGVRYETSPAQLRMLISKLQDLLAHHPEILPEPRRVRFLNLGASALEIEILAYINTTDYEHYLVIREELNFAILGLVAECGTECAFPTQATYNAKLEPLPEDKRRAAEAFVANHKDHARP